MRAAGGKIAVVTLAILMASSCSGGSGNSDTAELRTLILSTAEEALSKLQAEAEALGRSPLAEPIEGSLAPFFSSIAEVAEMFPTAAKDKSTNESKTIRYTGLSLATVKAAQESGGTSLKEPYATEIQVVDGLLKSANENKIGDLSDENFTEEVQGLLRPLGEVLLMADKGLADQLIPPDSPLRSNWDKDKDGRIESPLPPVRLRVGTQWQDFMADVNFERRRGSLIGRAILELELKVQKITLE